MFNYHDPNEPCEHYEEILHQAEQRRRVNSLRTKLAKPMQAPFQARVRQAVLSLLSMGIR